MRHYSEISHFRAPYKNAYLGQAEDVDPSGGLLVNKSGVFYWTDTGKQMGDAILANSTVVAIGDQNRVKLAGITEEQKAAAAADPQAAAFLAALTAAQWVQDRLAENKVVFAPTWLFAGGDVEMAAIPVQDQAAVKQAASTPLVGIYAEPMSATALFAKMGPLGVAAVGAVVIGGGYYAYKKLNKSRRSPYRGFV